MNQWKKICLAAMVLLVVGAVSVAAWQWNNLKAIYTFLTNDSQSIVEDLENKNQEQQDALNKDYHVTVQAPSIEHSDGLLDGKLDPDEVKDSLGLTQNTDKNTGESGEETKQDPEEHPKPDSSKDAPGQDPDASSDREEEPDISKPSEEAPADSQETDPQQEIEDLVNQCVAELYACEVDLMAQLGVMKQAALDEWRSLPEEERTTERKMEIGFAGLEKCYDLEVVIDEQVEDILDQYRTPLEKLGADTAVLNDLWDYYCEKKAVEKAYYMDKYLN